MAIFWLTHRTKRGTEIFIVEAAHLMMARIKAGMESGIQFDDATAKKAPPDWIGKTLSQAQAQQLLKNIA